MPLFPASLLPWLPGYSESLLTALLLPYNQPSERIGAGRDVVLAATEPGAGQP